MGSEKQVYVCVCVVSPPDEDRLISLPMLPLTLSIGHRRSHTHTHTLPGALKRSQFRLVVEWWGWHWYHHCHHRRSSAFCCCCFLTFLTGNHTHYQWQWLDVIGGGLQERVRRSAFRAEERFWEALRKEKERSCERAWRRRRLPSPSPSPPSPSIH